jgi:hypothetical protein
MQELDQKAQEMFALAPGSAQYSYVDMEQDKVSVKLDQELQDAYEITAASG